MLDKPQLIEAIRRTNPSAEQEFLGAFPHAELSTYLNRLTRIHGRRGRDTAWVRQTAMRSVVTAQQSRAA